MAELQAALARLNTSPTKQTLRGGQTHASVGTPSFSGGAGTTAGRLHSGLESSGGPSRVGRVLATAATKAPTQVNVLLIYVPSPTLVMQRTLIVGYHGGPAPFWLGIERRPLASRACACYCCYEGSDAGKLCGGVCTSVRHHASRCHMERGHDRTPTTGDPRRGEDPTEDPPPEGRATQGTHTEHTQT